MLRNWWSNLVYRFENLVTSRLFVVGILSAVMFSALVMRLFNLQIVEAENYQQEYQQTSTKVVEEEYTRGTIYDRNGEKLAYNKLAYAVEVADDGSYSAYERNLMLLRLIEILDKHKEDYVSFLAIEYTEKDGYQFTSSSERAHIRFLKDVGVYSDDENAREEQRHPIDWYTPDYVVEKLASRYGVGITIVNGRKQETYTVSPDQLLKLVGIRYALALNMYQKYVPITVANDVSEEAMADITEHEYDLSGVSVKVDSVRTYADAKYFSQIIGYTGQVSPDELDSLDSSYAAGDIIGKTGIEASFEETLKGVKGSRTLIVDHLGVVRSVESEVEPQAGNDVYLTIDRKMQIAAYNLLEQHLAGVLVSKIVNGPFKVTPGMASSQIMIPIKDVYYQLINNNVLSIDEFSDEDASDTEKTMYKKHQTKLDSMADRICSILQDENSKVNKEYDDETEDSLNYVFSILRSEEIIKSDALNTSSDLYKSWVADSISLREFLLGAMTNGWIDVTRINLTGKYADTEETMKALVAAIKDLLSEDAEYSKKIYRYLIDSETITGSELCIALFDQKVLKYDEADYNRLLNGGSLTAYSFIKSKISKIEITPAQLALDPCSGSVVVTDVKTGQVLALVSYPSYDNNRITTDSKYMASLNSDLSKPLFSRATLTKTAPGSIFKVITGLAAMKEGVIAPSEEIKTAANGIFESAGYSLACNIAPRNHGTLEMTKALEQSCNYFFSEAAYRMALDSSGNYSENRGLAVIQKYSELFGLGENSGIEISEASPHVTTTGAVPSGIGQGSHSYTNTQINRYVTVVASRGEVLDLNLVSKTTDAQGNLLEETKKQVIRKLDFTEEQWNTVYQGMYQAVNNNSKYKSWFSKLDVEVAGKTGTAQEDKKRGNHANFICFAPYDKPKVAVSVSMPNGYTAANSVHVASDVLAYYYGKIDLNSIMSSSASVSSGVDPAD